MHLIKSLFNTLLNLLLALELSLFIIMCGLLVYSENFSQLAYNERTRAIYAEIVKSTGQIQNSLPLVIIDSNTENAYTDGYKVVIYTGLIKKAQSWDEVALVLGHEVAHGMLGHVSDNPPFMETDGMGENDLIAVIEANADKLGAFYMMKAGYDVCKGRLLYKRWRDTNGNYLGQDHPDYSYRYDELDINCS